MAAGLLTLVAFGATPLQAQVMEIAPFVGYRFGNDLRNGHIDASTAYGAELSFQTPVPGYRVSLFYSYAQPTAYARYVGGDTNFRLNASFAGLGATREFLPGSPVTPVGGGHLMWTHLSAAGRSADFFGLSGHVGLKADLSETVALSGGWRLFSTIVDAGTGVYCGVGTGGSGCSLGFSGSSIFSSEFYGGVKVGLGSR